MNKSPIVALAFLLPTICLAQSNREQHAHDHGAGSVNIAIDDSTVYIEFEAPWDNLVGFEHMPSTSEQTELVEAALLTLQSPDELFSFNGSACTTETVDIDNTMASDADEHKDEHKDEHAENDADGHDDTHSAVFAEYEFACEDTSSMQSIDIAIFSVWQGFDELDVQVIGPKGATSIELTAGSASVSLDAVN